MRVKLQLVLCTDDGQEQTVTDVVTLQKDGQRLEHLGLTLKEATLVLDSGGLLLQQRPRSAAHFEDHGGFCTPPSYGARHGRGCAEFPRMPSKGVPDRR